MNAAAIANGVLRAIFLNFFRSFLFFILLLLASIISAPRYFSPLLLAVMSGMSWPTPTPTAAVVSFSLQLKTVRKGGGSGNDGDKDKIDFRAKLMKYLLKDQRDYESLKTSVEEVKSLVNTVLDQMKNLTKLMTEVRDKLDHQSKEKKEDGGKPE